MICIKKEFGDEAMERPNIIYILSDQHNPEVMGANGDPYVRTPNMDALAAKGVSLDNCYCASPLCAPSRSALLSGLLPSHTGVYLYTDADAHV